jgi:ABC-type glutathione transport system ATPase component
MGGSPEGPARFAPWGRLPERGTAKNRMGSLLQVRNLTIRYKADGSEPHLAVDGVSFDIAPGEVVGLMGESGCGKSSIALALLGLLAKQHAEFAGSVVLCGQQLLGMNEDELQKVRGSKISLVFQEPGIALSPVLRVGDQVAEVIHAHRRRKWKRCRAEAEAILARVGLVQSARIFSAYPHQLSGGQQQRVVLAQALCCEPALLVADEPTASLDARSQADFVVLLRDLKNELGISILLISHTPELQASLADRLLVMKDGRIIEEGSFEKLYENPAHHYTQMMLRRTARTKGTDRVEVDPVLQGQLI